jgi:hypothetical protein
MCQECASRLNQVRGQKVVAVGWEGGWPGVKPTYLGASFENETIASRIHRDTNFMDFPELQKFVESA